MNKTFRPGNIDFNACVGNNGHIDFLTYSLGYDNMVKIGLNYIDNTSIPSDLIIYPLIYNARHRIELFLKHQLIKIDYIKNKLITNNNTQQISRTHEISRLWDMFISETSFEPRFNDAITEIDEYIRDYAQIDDTGEVFRYPVTNGGIKHLTKLNVISLLTFKNRYLELSSKLESLDFHSSFLLTEYSQRTIAGSLSRDMIKSLADDLPPIETWTSNNFVNVKEVLKSKYKISSTTLSKAIQIIKEHFEFSLLLGRELHISEITTTELNEFIIIYDSFLKDLQLEDFNDTFTIHSKLLKEKLSNDAIYSLAQIYDIGYFRLYPEEYSQGLKFMLKKEIDFIIRHFLLGNKIVKDNIIRGLKICKQVTLLKSINE